MDDGDDDDNNDKDDIDDNYIFKSLLDRIKTI